MSGATATARSSSSPAPIPTRGDAGSASLLLGLCDRRSGGATPGWPLDDHDLVGRHRRATLAARATATGTSATSSGWRSRARCGTRRRAALAVGSGLRALLRARPTSVALYDAWAGRLRGRMGEQDDDRKGVLARAPRRQGRVGIPVRPDHVAPRLRRRRVDRLLPLRAVDTRERSDGSQRSASFRPAAAAASALRSSTAASTSCGAEARTGSSSMSTPKM